jgi:2-phospho-L-lactate guanylyltransferase
MAIAASNDGGTNLLACRPAGAISLHFGPHSFELHCRAAEHGRLTVQALNLLDLLFDIDSPDDLRRFVVLESRTRAHEFLSRLGIIDRLERRDVPPTADRVAAGASS